MHEVSSYVWKNLPTIDFRNRFFIEAWKEVLYVDTPAFYQSKVINTISGAEETIGCIRDFLEDPKNGKHLISVIEDYHQYWKNDKIAEHVYGNLYKKISELLSISDKALTKEKALELRTFCILILEKEEDYFEESKNKLKRAVIGDADLSKKDRITKEIYSLTKSFIGYLLWKGYSPTYLYNRMEMFTRAKNYGQRDFKAQLNSVLDKLTTRIHEYNVYFAISTLQKYLQDMGQLLGVIFIKYENQIPSDQFAKISQGLKTKTLAKITVSTTDYVSASWQANEILDRAIDFLAIEKPMHSISYSPLCFTRVQIGQINHKHTINIGLLKQFITSKKTSILDNVNGDKKFNFRESIKLERYDVLARSPRYLRIAKESTSLEQKLINIWIALECIFEKTEGNIISGIVKYIPKFYSASAVLSRISYSQHLLAKRLKEIPSDLIEGVGGTKKKFNELSLEECFDIMKVEANRHKIYKELDARDEQFLIFRIIHIYDELSDGQKISERLINTQKDVERQLYRIYRLRNKLAHRAFHNNVPPQFIDNLITYLLSSYSILISFSTYDKIQDFESQDIFNVFEASHEKMISKLKGETSLEELELSTVLIDSQY